MASYEVHPAGIDHARKLIDARQYVVRSTGNEVQPDAEAQNDYLDKHSWAEYGSWHLAVTKGATEETKARYAFGFGDFRRLHRRG